MRRRITYANVAATLALVFSMSGGALAATHYLINSTKQINPKVLNKLKGNSGPKGAAGATGAAGAAGATGGPGTVGPKGETGGVGPYPTVLASGATESGTWGAGISAATSTSEFTANASFPIPLPSAVTTGNIVYVSGATSATHCPGLGSAAAGFLCIYQGYTEKATTPVPGNVFNPELETGTLGAGRRGFNIRLEATGIGNTVVSGSYAVTAP